jgi:hypothetical protein
MNSDSDNIRSILLWLLRKNSPTDSPSGNRRTADVLTSKPILSETSASEVGSDAVSLEYWEPLDSEDLSPQFSTTSKRQLSSETAQSFNFGELHTVQDRFQALLKKRLRMEYENRPPLFPWESEVREYPVEIPAFAASQAASSLWLDNLRQLRVSNALPEGVLNRLLERCQIMAQTSLKQGVKLVRVVEALFPEQGDLLEPIANIVLTPAYRSTTDLKEAAIQELESLASDFAAATPEQQIALSMLAAQEIMAALTLGVSARQPKLVREWITAHGLLKLELTYQDNLLLIQASVPSSGKVHLLDGDIETQASRTQPGRLDLVWSAPEIGKTYTLEVSLPDTGHRPLRFSVSVTE